MPEQHSQPIPTSLGEGKLQASLVGSFLVEGRILKTAAQSLARLAEWQGSFTTTETWGWKGYRSKSQYRKFNSSEENFPTDSIADRTRDIKSWVRPPLYNKLCPSQALSDRGSIFVKIFFFFLSLRHQVLIFIYAHSPRPLASRLHSFYTVPWINESGIDW